MYDASGHMSVQLMTPGRPAFASGAPLGGTPEEIQTAFSGYFGYYGSYTVGEGTVTHHLRGCSFPNWVGVDQVRNVKLVGNRLTLSTPPFLTTEKTMVHTLVWERMP